MEIIGEKTLQASLEQVWQALNDTSVLKQCIPGCESLEQLSASEYTLVVTAAVGPIRVRFLSKLTLENVIPQAGYTMLFEGNGGKSGFGSGRARVQLDQRDAGVVLDYRAEAQIGGKLAQVGSRLIDSVAKKLAEEFFSRFNACLAGMSTMSLQPVPQAQ